MTDPGAPSLAERRASMRETAAWGTLTAYHMELTPDGRIVMVPKEFNPANYQ